MKELTGKVTFVTGGGRGLGEALCMALARRGARVVVADVRAALGRAVCDAIEGQGGEAFFAEIDLTQAEQAQKVLADTHRRFGRLDVLLNNAGIDLTAPIEDIPLEQWDRILATNLRAPFALAQAALPLMRKQGQGYIINVVSTAAKRAWANASAYHASKWGLLGFSHALHVEARKDGIKVSAVISGGMRTPFLLERFPDIDLSTLQDPANVAETICFLLSQPPETVIPELMVLPMKETSWP